MYTQSANGVFPFLIKPIYISLDWHNDDVYGWVQVTLQCKWSSISFFTVEFRLLCTQITHKSEMKKLLKVHILSPWKFFVGQADVDVDVYILHAVQTKRACLKWYRSYFWFSSRFFFWRKICAVSDSQDVSLKNKPNNYFYYIISHSMSIEQWAWAYSNTAYCIVCINNMKMGTANNRVWNQTTIKTSRNFCFLHFILFCWEFACKYLQ